MKCPRELRNLNGRAEDELGPKTRLALMFNTAADVWSSVSISLVRLDCSQERNTSHRLLVAC